MQQLRDETFTESAEADAMADPDRRSGAFPASEIVSLADPVEPRSHEWALNISLDQGLTGGCVGFAFAHWLAAEPSSRQEVSEDFARRVIYHGAQRIDRWPGGEYPGAQPIASGTSVLAAAKFLHHEGYVAGYRWGIRMLDLVLAVGYHGPVVIGLDWYQGMKRPDSGGRMFATGQRIGRHCMLVIAVNAVASNDGLDEEQSHVIFQNSAGPNWGHNGRATMTLAALKPLIEGAEICIPTPARGQTVKGD